MSDSDAAESTASVKISWGPNAKKKAVSAHTLDVLRELLASASETKATITSTARTPKDQARAMYQSLEADGVDYWRSTYLPPGQRVIDVYVHAKDQFAGNAAKIQALMEAKIYQEGPSSVSRHCADTSKLNVIDIARNSLKQAEQVKAALEGDDRVHKVIFEKRALHIEINQPLDNASDSPPSDSESESSGANACVDPTADSPMAWTKSNNASIAAEPEPEGGGDPEIEKLCLLGYAKDAAYALRKQFGSAIKFTSGFRPVDHQASAMAANQAQSQALKKKNAAAGKKAKNPADENYLLCYAGTWTTDDEGNQTKKFTSPVVQKMYDWCKDNPDAKRAEICQAFTSIMKEFPLDEVIKVSRHSAGRAFDLQPIHGGSGQKVMKFIGHGSQKGTGNLEGKSIFLTREGNLDRWHLQFNAKDGDLSYEDLRKKWNALQVEAALPHLQGEAESEKKEEKEEGFVKKEIEIAAGGTRKWEFPKKPKALGFVEVQLEFSVTLKTGGKIVFEEGAEEADEKTWLEKSWEKITQQVEKTLDTKTWKFGHPELKPLNADGGLEKGEKPAFGMKLGIALEVELGPVKGEIQLIILSFEKELAEEGKKGEKGETKLFGVEAALSKELELEEISLSEHVKVSPLTLQFEGAVNIEPNWKAIGKYIAKQGIVEVGLGVAIVVGSVATVVEAFIAMKNTWELTDTATILKAGETGMVAGFLDGLSTNSYAHAKAEADGETIDEESYQKAIEQGQKQRQSVIDTCCGGDASQLDTWLADHRDEVENKWRNDFREHQRKAAFINNVKGQGYGVRKVQDWWTWTIGEPPQAIGMIDLWKEYRGEYPDGILDSDASREIWETGNWAPGQ